MPLNLHLLRLFFEVANHGSFSRAADALFISQSATSKGVRELENQLGLPLIDRSPKARSERGLRLTPEGQALYEHARGIFALERAAVDDMQERLGLLRGSVTLGASTTVAAYWLPPYLAAFARQFPHIDLHLNVGNTHRISQGLLDCKVDLAVVEGAVELEGVESEYWRSDGLVIVAPNTADLGNCRADAERLSAHTWLLREPGSGTREAAERLLEEQRLKPDRCIELGSNEGIAHCVALGMGVALLPRVVVQDLLALGKLKTVATSGDQEFQRPLFRLRRARRPLSPAAQALCQLLDDKDFAGRGAR